ncbi:MAG: RNA ligase family protein [bacterium]
MGKTMGDFYKYPRVPHIFGSKGTPNDKRLDEKTSIQFLKAPGLIIEEKVDGTNTAIHFADDGRFVLQCRGHAITEGTHPQFDLFKSWAQAKQPLFHSILGRRFIMYGEWMYAKHQIFYHKLPHYFLEFDIFDKESNCFLDTDGRRRMLNNTSICSVPILHKGPLHNIDDLDRLIGQSRFSDCLAEGLYLKIEQSGKVIYRAKCVRRSFIQAVEKVGEHWTEKKMKPNKLLPGKDIWQ